MYYFSDTFIAGLQTKSPNFQNKFFDIIDTVGEFLDTEHEKQMFQKLIEENHSYERPGNTLYSTQAIFCGTHDVKTLKEKISFALLRTFDDLGADDIMVEAPHIIVCIATANKDFTEEDAKFSKSIINFERLCRGHLPALVTTILSSQDIGTTCYIACLK